MVIQALDLSVTLSNQAGFISFYGSIYFQFGFKNLFTVNQFFTRGKRGKSPGMFFVKCIEFFRNGIAPVFVFDGLVIGKRIMRIR